MDGVPSGRQRGEVKQETGKKRRKWSTAGLFPDERCGVAILEFLQSTGVAKMPPTEEGGGRAGAHGGGVMIFSLSVVGLYQAFFFLFPRCWCGLLSGRISR